MQQLLILLDWIGSNALNHIHKALASIGKKNDVACMHDPSLGDSWHCSRAKCADVRQTWQSVVLLDPARLGRPGLGHPGRNNCALGVNEANCQYY